MEGQTTLEMPSGHVTVTDGRAVVGDAFVDASDLEPVRAVLGDSTFESFMAEKLSGELAGEGHVCVLRLVSGGHVRQQQWSSYDKMSPMASEVTRKIGNSLGGVANKVKATTYGGNCANDGDCRTAQGPDCKCVAAGPAPMTGLDKCVANPCSKDRKARCEATTHHCVFLSP